ncbi:hypothetical protein ACB094_06G200200 [Castanea mollissima]
MSSDIDPYDHLCIFLNPDGTLTRFLELPKKKANPIATNGEPVVSKDHTLNAEKETHVRIYMPTIKLPPNDDTRIPIIIFYPFSNWYFSIWDSETNDRMTSELACQVPAIIVSVDYRLAPEHRLPAQYHDGVDAILWVREQALNPNGEQWIKDYGDISRCYLYGHSSGGNIAFFAALEATRMELEPLKIVGNIINQPLFGGMVRTDSELQSSTDPLLPLCAQDLCWELCLPKGENRDHWYCNPMVEGPHTSAISKLGKCLVIGFCGDVLIDRQQEFITLLIRHEVQIKALFHDFGFHAIDLADPKWANLIVEPIKDFIAEAENKP